MKELFERLRVYFKENMIANHHITVLEDLYSESKKEDLAQKKEITFEKLEFVKENEYAIFSDGACEGNPGPGGTGVVIQDSSGTVIYQNSSFFPKTTNNRMELTAAIQGLEYLTSSLKENSINTLVYLVSDSRYLLEGLTKWMDGWISNDWKKKKSKWTKDEDIPVLNVDLWKQLYKLKTNFKKIEVIWIKGHSGHPQNEYCDSLAVMVINSNIK